MDKKYKNSLFIFRRDLRLSDNTGLLQALSQSQQVIACFIFTPEQIGESNSYRGKHSIQFMIESLKDLHEQLIEHNGQLYLFYGSNEQVITELFDKMSIDAVFVNRDYTPYSLKRDQLIQDLCANYNKDFISSDDVLLNSPESVLTEQNKPYVKFTPFFRKSMQKKVNEPIHEVHGKFYSQNISSSKSKEIFYDILRNLNTKLYVEGGRKNGQKLIERLSDFANYAIDHDYPKYDTTLLSAHNKFGTFSIREIYSDISKKLSPSHPLIRQLYWRDFFTYIAYHYPHVFEGAFYQKYNNLKWSYDTNLFERWCEGSTGFPIVDAGMRQLNETGFMHNRVRLITASFLVKDLHINWQWGEKYFAQKLTDYDPAVNNGNWQWVASTGCDSQPYFRIFNPWLGQKKFDRDCIYIKRWIPELAKLDINIIHNWFKQSKSINGYPLPIVDHSKQSKIAKKLYLLVS